MLTLMTALCVAAPVVFVDGERVQTTEVSPNAVVATAGGVTLWLTTDRVWRLTTEWSKQDDAVLVFDERRALVGVSLRVKPGGRTSRFAGRDLSSLRGFSVEGWDSDVERLIKALPGASCASIASAPLTLEVRKLPAALECLELDFEGSEKLLTLDLSRFTKLAWLSVSAGEHARLKALPKALTNVTLRRLTLDVVSLTRLEGLVWLTLDDVNVRELSGRHQARPRHAARAARPASSGGVGAGASRHSRHQAAAARTSTGAQRGRCSAAERRAGKARSR